MKLDSFFGATHQSFGGSTFNPGNRVLYLSENYGFIELRPEAKLGLKKNAVVVRPRVRATLQPTIDTTPASSEASTIDVWLNEGYAVASPISDLEISLGRQIFQWGPAEVLNPSNLFHQELLARLEPFYEVRGKTMARVNWSVGQQWSWVTMAELMPLPDDSFDSMTQIDDESLRRLQTKLEFNWNNGANYLAATAGQREINSETSAGIGGYGAYTLNDAFQIYSDVIFLENTRTDEFDFYGLAGLRYTTVGGTEFRIEGINNQRGLTSGEFDTLRAILQNPFFAQFAAPVLQNNDSPLLGRGYVYSSVRYSLEKDWLGMMQPMFSLRNLFSTGDQSSFSSVNWEAGLAENAMLYIYGGLAAGQRDSELRQSLDRSIGLAVRISL